MNASHQGIHAGLRKDSLKADRILYRIELKVLCTQNVKIQAKFRYYQ